MTTAASKTTDKTWQRFVIDHGHKADSGNLAFLLGVTKADINRLRATQACKKSRRKNFGELFELWHGREASDEDWPPPRRVRAGEYEWQPPEIALLASLVGEVGKKEIAQTLTTRLRLLTGDSKAARTGISVQNTIARIGLQDKNVVGGITTAAAAKEIGSLAIINHAIHKRELRAMRVGRLWVIPHQVWQEWKDRRIMPPAGYVQLSTIREKMAIRSDKLSEFARLGHIPTAIRCKPSGTGTRTTKFGTWYVSAATAEQLVADRRAGRPMPWQGKPIVENLQATYRLWLSRKHPASCKTCAEIWGPDGAPKSWESYATRYPPIAFGAKRHLTMVWSPGLTVAEIAHKSHQSNSRVRQAIAAGALDARKTAGALRASKSEVTRWISRGCPAGKNEKSWISLETASSRYLFTKKALKELIAEGRLKTKIGTNGPMRGVVYVPRSQCTRVREEKGFTEREAARRAGITVGKLREILEGLNWRGTGAIPLVTLQAVIKRLHSSPGYTIEEAGVAVGKSAAWVEARIGDGTVRVLQTKWADNRPYISKPMLRRLKAAAKGRGPKPKLGDEWLRLGAAAMEAGVVAATIVKWGELGEVAREHEPAGWRYQRESLRARARTYWQTVRFLHAKPPAWLQAEACG